MIKDIQKHEARKKLVSMQAKQRWQQLRASGYTGQQLIKIGA